MLLDNTSSHVIAGRETITVGSFDSLKLSNLLLIFLLANCASVIQPLDQEIIAAFKACYERKLTCHKVAQLDIDALRTCVGCH